LINKRQLTLVIIVGLIFSLTSCLSHKDPFDQYYFQALGDENKLVVTTTEISSINLESLISDENLIKRIERISIEIDDWENKESSFRGAIEGKIPATITNAVLNKTEGWEKVVYPDKLATYKNEQLNLELVAPKKNLLLFANDNFYEHLQKTYKSRQLKIELEKAKLMGGAMFGFYIASPQTMIELGLEIPKSALLQSESLLVYITKENLLGSIITMKSERLASSLSILLKSSYISEKRRNKEELGDLEGLFTLEENRVIVKNLPVKASEVEDLSNFFLNATIGNWR
jgi:hypothetical protein